MNAACPVCAPWLQARANPALWPFRSRTVRAMPPGASSETKLEALSTTVRVSTVTVAEDAAATDATHDGTQHSWCQLTMTTSTCAGGPLGLWEGGALVTEYKRFRRVLVYSMGRTSVDLRR